MVCVCVFSIPFGGTGNPLLYLHSQEGEPTPSVDSSPSSTKLRKVKKGGQLKETKKTKLTETVSKKLSKKFKQTLTSRKCREQLDSSDTVSLLPSSSLGRSDSDEGISTQKKSVYSTESKTNKKGRSSISFGESSVLHYDTVSPLDASIGSHGNSSPGRGLLKEPLIRRNKAVGGKRERLLEARRLRRQKRKVSSSLVLKYPKHEYRARDMRSGFFGGH